MASELVALFERRKALAFGLPSVRRAPASSAKRRPRRLARSTFEAAAILAAARRRVPLACRREALARRRTALALKRAGRSAALGRPTVTRLAAALVVEVRTRPVAAASRVAPVVIGRPFGATTSRPT